MRARHVMAALAPLALGACFIEELPAYDSTDIGPVGGGPVLRGIDVGNGTTCAVVDDGTVRCWGSYPRGLFPDGMVGLLQRPVRVDGLTGVDEIALGGNHGCARQQTAVACFGENPSGQLGQGTVTPSGSAAPTPVPGFGAVTQIAARGARSMALTSDGAVWQWGAQFVIGVTPSPQQVAGVTGATMVALGDGHACALVGGGQVACWGDNAQGQLGRGTIPATPPTVDLAPAPVVGVSDATMVTAGNDSCVLHATGAVSCWGFASFNPPQPTPTPMAGPTGVTKITGGGGHTCAIAGDRTVWCWGSNYQGALGLGADVPDTPIPVQVPGLADIVDIDAGGYATCARRADRVVLCWGGQPPGNGTAEGSPTPVPVAW